MSTGFGLHGLTRLLRAISARPVPGLWVLLCLVPALAAGAPPIFVLNSLDATISVIDGVSRTELRRIPTGKEPHHLYLTPDEKSLIVANATGHSLTFIDPVNGVVQRVVRDIPDPYHLRFSPDMKWFVTASNRLNRVDLYRWQPADAERPLKLAQRIEAPKTPSHLSIDSRSSVVYASLQDSDELLAIDLATLGPRWKIKIGKVPADIFLTPDDRTLLVGLTGDKVVEAYDVSVTPPKTDQAHPHRRGRACLPGARRPQARVCQQPRGQHHQPDRLPRPDRDRRVSRPGRAGLHGDDEGRPDPAVSSRWARKLSIIDTVSKKVTQQIDVGKSPHGVWTLDHAPRQ
jgi:DNA-binding beta-propeller fold protein YncE